MTEYFLGADVGGTKTYILIADEQGTVLGYGLAGPGNHESVGWDGLEQSLSQALNKALVSVNISKDKICGAGFGIGGFDWEYQREPHIRSLSALGLNARITLVNDTILGLVAGASEGWGVGIVSGTGCNCWGWDSEHKREGRVTGLGLWMGEAAGASELVGRAIQLVCHEWTKRGQPTALTPAFIKYTGANNLEDLIVGYCGNRYRLGPAAARVVFEVAESGDEVARDLIHWAGKELGEMANGVIRQLRFENLIFETVLIGSMFQNGDILINPMKETIQTLAPGARLIRLTAPPAVGAVLLGMEAAGLRPDAIVRENLYNSAERLR
jgi:N-acetylglucosamine kinase-like BadF-type ATPase